MITKEEIIQEVQRTAKANGGLPLGASRFKSQTGIRTYDWMRYWPRYNELLKEAGFAPNVLTSAYEMDHLLELYIEFTRELGHLPTRGDLQVKENSDPRFPTHSTFGNRLGNKQILLSKLIKYAEKKKYNDIRTICKIEFDKNSEKKEETEDIVKDIAGSVYLAKSGRYYKIGRTNSLGRRHHEITILLPESFTLVHEIKTDDPSGIEAYWHNRFELKRKNGEWFDLNSSDVKAFKRWRRIT